MRLKHQKAITKITEIQPLITFIKSVLHLPPLYFFFLVLTPLSHFPQASHIPASLRRREGVKSDERSDWGEKKWRKRKDDDEESKKAQEFGLCVLCPVDLDLPSSKMRRTWGSSWAIWRRSCYYCGMPPSKYWSAIFKWNLSFIPHYSAERHSSTSHLWCLEMS